MKRHVAIVSKQAVAVFGRGFLQRRLSCPVGEVDVHAAVVVVVQDGDAAGHELDLVVVAGGRIRQPEGNPCLYRYFVEPDLGCQGSSQGQRSQKPHRALGLWDVPSSYRLSQSA